MSTNTFNTLVEPPPLDDVFVDKSRFASKQLADWLLLVVVPRLQGAAQVRTATRDTGQHANVGPSSIVPVASAGDYRINWYMQVTTVDSTGLVVTFNALSTAFTQSITQSGAAMNGNTLATVQSGSFIVKADAGSVISFSITAVLGTGDGRFAYDVVPEFLG